MTATNTTNAWETDGKAAGLPFTFNNRIFAASDLKVYVDGVLQGSGYTVTGVNDPDGGTVTFASLDTTGSTVRILRDVPATQELNYETGSVFPAETTEKGFDKVTVLIQQAAYKLGRALRWADDEDGAPTALLPAKADRLGKFLLFDAVTGAPTVGVLGSTEVAFTTIGQALAGAATALAARTAIGLANITFKATGSKARIYELDGSSDPDEDGWWWMWNVEYDAANGYFKRIDETVVGYGLQFAENITGETGTGGVILWRVRPSSEATTPQTPTAKVTPWTVGVQVGSWEPIVGGTEFRDIFIGGFGTEEDGNGPPPFGRRQTRLSGTTHHVAGNVANGYLNDLAADRINHKSARLSFRYDKSSGPPYAMSLVLQGAPEGNVSGGDVVDPNPPAYEDYLVIPIPGATTSYGWLQAGAASAAYTSAGVKTAFAHGLPVQPTVFTVIAECTATDLGYAVGDRCAVGGWTPTPADAGGTTFSQGGIGIVVDDDNCQVIVGTSIYLPNKSTGSVGAVTLSKWEITVTPYAVILPS